MDGYFDCMIGKYSDWLIFNILISQYILTYVGNYNYTILENSTHITEYVTYSREDFHKINSTILLISIKF